jgi:hypothetical protein
VHDELYESRTCMLMPISDATSPLLNSGVARGSACTRQEPEGHDQIEVASRVLAQYYQSQSTRMFINWLKIIPSLKCSCNPFHIR